MDNINSVQSNYSGDQETDNPTVSKQSMSRGVFGKNDLLDARKYPPEIENPFAGLIQLAELSKQNEYKRKPIYPKARTLRTQAKRQAVKPVFENKVESNKEEPRPKNLKKISIFNPHEEFAKLKKQKGIKGGIQKGIFGGTIAEATHKITKNKSLSDTVQKVLEPLTKNKNTSIDEEHVNESLSGSSVSQNTLLPVEASDISSQLSRSDIPQEQGIESGNSSQNALHTLFKIYHVMSQMNSSTEKISYDTGTLVKLAYTALTKSNQQETVKKKLMEKYGIPSDAGIGGKEKTPDRGILSTIKDVALGVVDIGVGVAEVEVVAATAAATKVVRTAIDKFDESFGPGGKALIQQLRKDGIIEYDQLGDAPHVKNWDVIEKLPKDQIQILINTKEFGKRDLAHLEAILKAPASNLKPIDKSTFEKIEEPGWFDQGGRFGAFGEAIGVGEHDQIKAEQEQRKKEEMAAKPTATMQRIMDKGNTKEFARKVQKEMDTFSIKSLFSVKESKEYESSKNNEKGDAKLAMKILMDKGWTKEQAAGIVANLHEESGLNTHGKPGDSGKAMGIAQWHKDRRDEFERVFKKPFEESTFTEQVEFVDYELQHGKEQQAGKKIKETTGYKEAAIVTEQSFERSAAGQAGGYQASRPGLARVYSEFSKEEIAGAGVGVEPTTSQKPINRKDDEQEDLNKKTHTISWAKDIKEGTTYAEMEAAATGNPIKKAKLIKEPSVREPLLTETIKSPSIIQETPSEMAGLRQSIMSQQKQQAASSPVNNIPHKPQMINPSMMNVRNDDPLLLDLAYSNLRTN